MNLQRYLDRIEYSGSIQPNLSILIALHEAHVFSVPFENLDVQLGKSLSICIEDAYEKIVNNTRGGWCYEQNGLFGWVLTETAASSTSEGSAWEQAPTIRTTARAGLRIRRMTVSSLWVSSLGAHK